MTLAAGSRLGPYQILAPLGAGGMGEVYKARDTRLDRVVAVKVLPTGVADDPQRRERFEREARAISSLNNPHICTLYDVGHQDGIVYLVMELLEGQPLNERLAKGALPLDQALQYAIQIAGALDAAHRSGIVHRDLKPANVMLTKAGAKLLDFGIVKAVARGTGVTAAPTLTAEGVLLGTLQYMSPEQLEGREADARSDVFAFGALLYEMLTGTRAFAGESQSSVIAAVLDREPPSLLAKQPQTPPALDRVVRKCLAKNPDERWHTAHDLRDELQWIATGYSTAVSSPAAGRSSRWLGWSAIALSLIAAIVIGGDVYLRRPAADTHVYRSTFAPPAPLTDFYALTLSPDGRHLAMTAPAAAGGRSVLWVRALDSLSPQPLAETEGATGPFWSPDSRSVAFFADQKLKRIDASGGPVTIVADAAFGPGAWSRDDVILFTPPLVAGEASPLFRVAATGGAPVPATVIDSKESESFHRFPSFLPDGRHFLFTTFTPTEPGRVFVGSLDSNERIRLFDSATNARYAQGDLLFMRNDSLMAQPFDSSQLKLLAAAVPIAEKVRTVLCPGRAYGTFTVSDTGVLAFQGGGAGGSSELVWFDRTGKQTSVLGERAWYAGCPGASAQVTLSPDGAYATATISSAPGISPDIWMVDTARGVRTRLTSDPAREYAGIWSPDGRTIAFSSNRNGHRDLYQTSATGVGTDHVLRSDRFDKFPESWSPDGRFLLYFNVGPTAPGHFSDIWALPLFGDRKPFPFIESRFDDRRSQFSPDGRWVAYQSDESGRSEVYVVPFPGRGGKFQISKSGGSEPRWRGDGKEIFFLDRNTLMVAAVASNGNRFEVGSIQRLFDVKRPPAGFLPYDVSRDGQRFLVHVDEQPPMAGNPITVVVNWPALLKKP